MIGKPGPFQVIDNEEHTAPAGSVSSSVDTSPAAPASLSSAVIFSSSEFAAFGTSAKSTSLPAPRTPPRRRYDCSNYEACLNLAAALNWDSFTCRGCNGDVNQALYWQAHQMGKRDKLVTAICELPSLTAHKSAIVSIAPKKVAAKR